MEMIDANNLKISLSKSVTPRYNLQFLYSKAEHFYGEIFHVRQDMRCLDSKMIDQSLKIQVDEKLYFCNAPTSL